MIDTSSRIVKKRRNDDKATSDDTAGVIDTQTDQNVIIQSIPSVKLVLDAKNTV